MTEAAAAPIQRILVLFAHPMIHRSNVNRALIASVTDLDHVTIHDLYAAYPDLYIDVKHEQQLLREHDIIIFQHPLYWYSAPSILKMWQDLVLQYGFAYGSEGTALRGKQFMNVITAGASMSTYHSEAVNRYTIDELLRPVEQMAHFTGMHYLPPYVIYGTHRILQRAIMQHAEEYRNLLIELREGHIAFDDDALLHAPQDNPWDTVLTLLLEKPHGSQ